MAQLLLSNRMKLTSTVNIDAPLKVVWAVTEDVEHWSEWTPTVESIRRLDTEVFDVDSTAILKLPNLPSSVWTVVAFVREKHFQWESKVIGIHMVATHEMRSVGTKTESIIEIEMTALVVTLLEPLFRVFSQRMLEQENLGLKQRCEARAC